MGRPRLTVLFRRVSRVTGCWGNPPLVGWLGLQAPRPIRLSCRHESRMFSALTIHAIPTFDAKCSKCPLPVLLEAKPPRQVQALGQWKHAQRSCRGRQACPEPARPPFYHMTDGLGYPRPIGLTSTARAKSPSSTGRFPSEGSTIMSSPGDSHSIIISHCERSLRERNS